jgi:predicted HicB family RNase H-like nuclease
MTTEAQKKASRKWENEKAESIRLRVPKGKNKTIQELAEKNGESINGLINRLIDNEINK